MFFSIKTKFNIEVKLELGKFCDSTQKKMDLPKLSFICLDLSKMELILREKLQTRESSVLKLHRSKIYEAQTGWQNMGRCPQAEKKGLVMV